ncbi:uncharacterized protein NKAPD1 [Rhinophrynus dorsalis]
MSRVPLGKVLLRNVIRHTDAHNKIQEESEMWKIRELEKQTELVYGSKRKRSSPELNKWDHNGYKELYPEEFDDKRSRMRSDGFDTDVNREPVKRGAAAAVTLREDALSVRAWNKKFYECEASIPDRWGHSGYKELYPEEFDTDRDGDDKSHKRKSNGQEKTTKRRAQKEQESHKRKRSKKTHKKKQKKRSHKKLKKRKKQQEESTETSSESEGSDNADKPKKSKRKKKTRKKTARKQPSSSGQDSDSLSDEMSSTEEVETEERKSRLSRRSSKKQRHRSKPKKDIGIEEKKSRRTNWKVAKDESSDSSSDED